MEDLLVGFLVLVGVGDRLELRGVEGLELGRRQVVRGFRAGGCIRRGMKIAGGGSVRAPA
jgi:hypothetical protein